jgi:hypothetical protein
MIDAVKPWQKRGGSGYFAEGGYECNICSDEEKKTQCWARLDVRRNSDGLEMTIATCERHYPLIETGKTGYTLLRPRY